MAHNAEKATQSLNREQFNKEETRQLTKIIGEALLDKKGEDITVLNVSELTTLTDAFVVCHAGSDVQVKALADSVTESTREQLNEKPWKKEGLEHRRWVILDYVNVVVHIFKQELRDHYALERIWSDAEITKIEDE
ncbi:MAG TPA: ribosome silencing factor [Balneolaceae bacterium]|nr:ribosome silencing factor [Balneolaceae bacterium]